MPWHHKKISDYNLSVFASENETLSVALRRRPDGRGFFPTPARPAGSPETIFLIVKANREALNRFNHLASKDVSDGVMKFKSRQMPAFFDELNDIH